MPPTDKHGERSFAICKDHHDADWNQPELENESCVLCRLFYLEAQEQLLEEWQQRAKRAEEAIKEMERPLDAQMARLNATVASLNAENEMLKSARSADRSQEPAAWLEVGEKSGVVGVSLERDDSSPFGWEPLYRAPVAPASSERATNTEALATMDRFINGIKAEVKKTGGFSFVGESAVYWIARFREVSEALAAPSATSSSKDEARLSWLDTLLRHCPHADLTYNDDDDGMDGPQGFSLTVESCSRMELHAPTLAALIDLGMSTKPDEDGNVEATEGRDA